MRTKYKPPPGGEGQAVPWCLGPEKIAQTLVETLVETKEVVLGKVIDKLIRLLRILNGVVSLLIR